MTDVFDVVVVGGDRSAALLLGRCRRSVFLCDAGQPRNQASIAVHGLLTHEGTRPSKLLAKGTELERYPSVEIHAKCVSEIKRSEAHFSIACEDGFILKARKILIATGLIDEVPQLDGIERFYGRSVHHCPYCDAFEPRDQPLAVYGVGALR